MVKIKVTKEFDFAELINHIKTQVINLKNI